MLKEFLAGFRDLGHGFGMWCRRPRLMLLGLLPAAIAFIVLAAALTGFGVSLPRLVDWSTPFADGWQESLRIGLRITLGAVLFGGAAALAAVTFTALSLIIGDPFYAHIHLQTEADCGPPLPTSSVTFTQTVAAGARLVLLGVGVAALVWLAGFLPFVGTPLAAVLGVTLTGRLLASEVLGRPFDARGFDRRSRGTLIAARRWRVLGFGIATQLCFLIPLGAVVTMPAAVAGATFLTRDLLRPATEPDGAEATGDRV